MQPTLIVTSPVPGLLYLNGRLAGEMDARHPQVLPVSPYGALYLEHRPLVRTHLPMACRITLSEGMPVAESLEQADGVEAVLWPGQQLEAELTPPGCDCGLPEVGRSGGLNCTRWGQCLLVETDAGGVCCTLPEGACMPRRSVLNGVNCLCGTLSGGGAYAQVYSRDFSSLLLSLSGQQVRVDSDELLEVIVDPQDLVGHARLEVWQVGEGGCSLLRGEPIWAHGMPSWPQTPRDTALAALQAAQQGLTDEAKGYLSPTAEVGEVFELARRSRGCVPLGRPTPGGENCVGLLTLVNRHLLTVQPIAYQALPSAGMQGPYHLSRLSAVVYP